jgi:hypothetical protein
MKKIGWVDWLVSIAGGLTLGMLLARLDRQGHWWQGWLAFSLLSILVCASLLTAWRWAGSRRGLGLLLFLAFSLRLGLGVSLSVVLPSSGYNTPVQQAGYNSVDAYERDRQAWELSISNRSILAAFDKSFAIDQYGGLEALSALVYRSLSPDAHRPWLILLLSALASSLGVAFLWKAACSAWDEKIALLAAWGFALYPEGLWWGASQMREPYLLMFISLVFLGVVAWQVNHEHKGWGSIVIGITGMLFFSPGIAIYTILLLAGWVLLRKKHMRIPWKGLGMAAGVLLLAVLVLWVALRRGTFANAPLVETLSGWWKYSMAWDVYQLERDSGMIQYLFREVLNPQLKLPFIFIYGLLQPVLPAAIFDTSSWLWQTVGILRSLGWYLLLPLLGFSLVAILRSEHGEGRLAWLWLFIFNWSWIAISVLRAGGDQWDNPRYRLIFLGFQALLAGKAWLYYRASHDPWLPRIGMIELVFILLFADWYAARYFPSVPAFSFKVMLLVIIAISVMIVLGGLWLDWRKNQQKGTAPEK